MEEELLHKYKIVHVELLNLTQLKINNVEKS